MKAKTKITRQQLHSIRISQVREDQKVAGCFDGRFRTKSEQSKKSYTRKEKHKATMFA
jgi:stalled ribosome alternative rescue factor ArfA